MRCIASLPRSFAVASPSRAVRLQRSRRPDHIRSVLYIYGSVVFPKLLSQTSSVELHDVSGRDALVSHAVPNQFF